MKVTVGIPVFNQEELVIRALESIPKRDDIEIIVIDDGSTDNTWNNLLAYRKGCPNFFNLILLYNEENKGVAYTVNRIIDNAKGDYIVILGSDDYFYPDKFNYIVDTYLDHDYDMVYFNLEQNSGVIVEANEKTTRESVGGSVKFMKKSFVGDIRCPVGVQFGEDGIMHFKILEKNPKELFTGIVAKHYNYPRKGSLCWQYQNKKQ